MRYTESPESATELIDAIEGQLAIERAEKTDSRPHVGDLTYCLRASWRKKQLRHLLEIDHNHCPEYLHPENYMNFSTGEWPDPVEHKAECQYPNCFKHKLPREEENHRLILLIGQALHTIVAKALGREANKRLESDWLVGEADARLVRSTLVRCDACFGSGTYGIHESVCPTCSGTGQVPGPDKSFIEEFKTARAGFSIDDPIKWPQYIEQVASYIVLARSMGLNTLNGVLHVLHLTFSGPPRWYEPHPRKLKRESEEEFKERLDQTKRQARIEYEQKVADWVIEQGKHSNLRSWPLEFADWEIDAWEKELRRRAAIWSNDAVEPDVNENVPADKTGYSWTCAYCPFFFKRGGDCSGGIGRPASFFPADRLDGEISVGEDDEGSSPGID